MAFEPWLAPLALKPLVQVVNPVLLHSMVLSTSDVDTPDVLVAHDSTSISRAFVRTIIGIDARLSAATWLIRAVIEVAVARLAAVPVVDHIVVRRIVSGWAA